MQLFWKKAVPKFFLKIHRKIVVTVFSCECSKHFPNYYCTEPLWMTASGKCCVIPNTLHVLPP